METNHFSVLISPRLFLKTPAFAGLLSSLGLLTPRFSAQGWIFRGGGDWRGLMRNMERVKRTPEVSLLVDADVRQIRAFPAQLGSDLGAVGQHVTKLCIITNLALGEQGTSTT